MQTLTLSSKGTNGRLLESKTSLGARIGRFVSERYAQRERPSVAAEFTVLALIVLLSTWPMFTLVHTMGLSR